MSINKGVSYIVGFHIAQYISVLAERLPASEAELCPVELCLEAAVELPNPGVKVSCHILGSEPGTSRKRIRRVA
jgi:hypothetical protein